MNITIQKIRNKIVDRVSIVETCQKWKDDGKSVVFTNGCFDILHFGHIYLLSEAANHGDCLLVGLNSDRSVNEIKGEGRPLVGENDRAMLIASLSMVDAIVIFEEPTPGELIREISPDVLVKGGDYQVDEIVGADHVMNKGGSVKIVSFQENYSTTAMIKKMSTR